jgi:hypothetical protein
MTKYLITSIAIIITIFACRSGNPASEPQGPKVEPTNTSQNSFASKHGDPSTKETKTMTDDESALLAKLNNPDEQVRVDAALALHARKHPGAVEACLHTINDGADELHLDRTPAVRCLVEIGMPALTPLLDLLLAPEQMTRLRAQRAIEDITLAHPDFHAPDRKAREANWRSWWRAMGYAYDAGEAQRQDAVSRLRTWAAARKQAD